MEVHKPKEPIHGRREFFGEVGIIVLGVLIALGAEQAVEALHTAHIIREAETAMHSELVDDDLPQAYVRLAILPCLSDELEALRKSVAQRVDPPQFYQLARKYGPPRRTWDEDAWRATQSSVAGARMDSKRLLAWSGAYALVPGLARFGSEEQRAVDRLHRTRYGGGVWTPQREDELNDLLDELQGLANDHAQNAQTLLRTAPKVAPLTPAAQDVLFVEAAKVYGTCARRPHFDIDPLKQRQVYTQEDELRDLYH